MEHFSFKTFPCCKTRKSSRPPWNELTRPGEALPRVRIPGLSQCLAVVLCHNTTVSSWYSNWWCWHRSPWITWGRYGDAALLFNARMGSKTRGSRNCKPQTFISIQFLRSRQSGTYGTCHACHTLDTPLLTSPPGQSHLKNFRVSVESWFGRVESQKLSWNIESLVCKLEPNKINTSSFKMRFRKYLVSLHHAAFQNVL